MDKRTAKMIAYSMASAVIYDAAHGSQLAEGDERVETYADVAKIVAALDEISTMLQERAAKMDFGKDS